MITEEKITGYGVPLNLLDLLSDRSYKMAVRKNERMVASCQYSLDINMEKWEEDSP